MFFFLNIEQQISWNPHELHVSFVVNIATLYISSNVIHHTPLGYFVCGYDLSVDKVNWFCVQIKLGLNKHFSILMQIKEEEEDMLFACCVVLAIYHPPVSPSFLRYLLCLLLNFPSKATLLTEKPTTQWRIWILKYSISLLCSLYVMAIFSRLQYSCAFLVLLYDCFI
jgi:hypothetical protein